MRLSTPKVYVLNDKWNSVMNNAAYCKVYEKCGVPIKDPSPICRGHKINSCFLSSATVAHELLC